MTVTPWTRISEEVLRQSILEMYTRNSLIPAGISVTAMGTWCEKMAFGIHKVVRRFRKLYSESPTSSKGSKLQALKDRCLASGVPVCKPQGSSDSLESHTPRSASAQDLETVSPPPLDWSQILQRLRQRKANSTECRANSVVEPAPELTSKVPADKTVQARPVATPARAQPKQKAVENKWVLPSYVINQLQKKEDYVPPFDTQGADDGEEAAAIDAELAEPVKKKKKAKAKRKTKNQRKPKAKKETFGAQDEAALTQEAPGAMAAQPVQAELPAPAEQEPKKYVPGEFDEHRKKFIKAAMAEHGIRFRAASDLWMASSERASYMVGVTFSEMKKRRFM
eukprot:Skav229462  [mRNA]  locus=scaffold577:142898:143911:+ [translate_table: standard]